MFSLGVFALQQKVTILEDFWNGLWLMFQFTLSFQLPWWHTWAEEVDRAHVGRPSRQSHHAQYGGPQGLLQGLLWRETWLWPWPVKKWKCYLKKITPPYWYDSRCLQWLKLYLQCVAWIWILCVYEVCPDAANGLPFNKLKFYQRFVIKTVIL